MDRLGSRMMTLHQKWWTKRRKRMTDRSSEADEPFLIKDPSERARVEAANTLRQFDVAVQELRRWLRNPGRRLRPSDILALHRILMQGLSEYAGVHRPAK